MKRKFMSKRQVSERERVCLCQNYHKTYINYFVCRKIPYKRSLKSLLAEAKRKQRGEEEPKRRKKLANMINEHKKRRFPTKKEEHKVGVRRIRGSSERLNHR